jgi:hypothetical protein
MPRQSVFISYAHKDGLDFTRRLAFALSMYMDVFWDRRLQAGEYPPQLYAEIEAKDHFLLVLTPYSVASEWCEAELAHAEQNKKPITLALVYRAEETQAEELMRKYTYGDFSKDFEEGFRRISMMMLGRSLSSWEMASLAKTEDIINTLQYGTIPALISKEIIDWVVVNKLWPEIEAYVSRRQLYIFRGVPQTAMGVVRHCQLVMKQSTDNRDQLGYDLAKRVSDLADPVIREILAINDDEHQRAGETAFKLIQTAKENQRLNAIGFREANALHYIDGGYFDFDVTEKIRELINVHARRSRYLY